MFSAKNLGQTLRTSKKSPFQYIQKCNKEGQIAARKIWCLFGANFLEIWCFSFKEVWQPWCLDAHKNWPLHEQHLVSLP